MRAFILALSLMLLSGCAASLVDDSPCIPSHPYFDSVETHDDGSITLTEVQTEALLIYIDELEVCNGL